MAQSTTSNPPVTRTMATDLKKCSTHNQIPSQNTSIVDQLRKQAPSQQSKRKRNDDTPPLSQRSLSSTTDTMDIAPTDFELDFDNETLPTYHEDNINQSDKHLYYNS